MPDTTPVPLGRGVETNDHAERALALVQDQPALAASLAAPLTTSRDPLTRTIALWALGRASYEHGEMREARRLLGRAVREARSLGRTDLEGSIRSSLAIVLVEAGATTAALDELDAAEPLLDGAALGRLLNQRTLVLSHLGRHRDALVAAERAEPHLRAGGDDLGLARLLINRSLGHLALGELPAAERDLMACRVLAEALGQHLISAAAGHNLGVVSARRGDVPGALAWFDEARRRYGELGDPGRVSAVLDADLAEALLIGALSNDAVLVSRRAVVATSAGGNVVHEAEARVVLARALLARGEAGEARREAQQAVRLLKRSRRGPWATWAGHVAMQASALAFDQGESFPAGAVARAVALADDLDAHHWRREALQARTFAGRLALERGQVDVARKQLAIAATARRNGPASARAGAWHATALLRLADGDRRGARRAIAAGLTVVERHRATLGATELRARSAAHGSQLARLGLRLAVDDGRPLAVLEWADRWRATSLGVPPVRPPEDPMLAAALAELRDLTSRRRRALAGGQPVDELDRAAARLERVVVARHRLGGSRHGDDERRLTSAELRRHLDGAVLVSFVELDGALVAVTVTDRHAALHSIGPIAGLVIEVRYLRAAIRRVAARSTDPDRASPLAAGLSAAAGRLDALLMGPLGLAPEGPLVIVPSGSLSGLPWSALPSLTLRPFSVAPSAALWAQRVAAGPSTRGRVGLVAGPDLPGAQREVMAITRMYAGATALTGSSATAAKTLALFESSDLVHVAAHGSFRADSPLFSSLRAVDGPLTVYDLEQLRRVPATVVLSACDAATAAALAGDELLGTSAALLGLGVSSIVASVGLVPDEATARFMVELHGGLVAGLPVAEALAAARRRVLRSDDPGDCAAAALFLCLGSGRS